MNNKLAISILILAIMAGCGQNSYEEVTFPAIPDGLKDCKFFNLQNDKHASMRVARCPNSTTTITYSQGKTQASAVIIDGVEYVKKEETKENAQ